jgi:hypothetical protein
MVKWAVLALLLAAAPTAAVRGAEVGPAWSPPTQQQDWAPPPPVMPGSVITPVEPGREPLHQTRFQQPPTTDPAREQQTIQLIPPGPERIYRLESEDSLQERMRQEAADRGEKIAFPDEPILSTRPYPGRHWPDRPLYVEANYVCYQRLLFEEKNSERYGWDLGAIGPFVSAAYFFKDLVLLPYHLAEDPCRCYECSAGYCLPGDPVPYLCYPPNLSLSGAAVEAGTIVALLAIFP